VTRQLLSEGVTEVTDFKWLCHLRFRTDTAPTSTNATSTADKALMVHMADATFDYGFEYLGVGERLVQTPLTDRSAHVSSSNTYLPSMYRTLSVCQKPCFVQWLKTAHISGLRSFLLVLSCVHNVGMRLRL
jgi:hypothetical protein